MVPTDMAACANCGTSLTGKEAFCTFCGTKVVRSPAADDVEPATIDPYAATSKRAEEVAESLANVAGSVNAALPSVQPGAPIDPMASTVAKDPELTAKPLQPIPGISRVSPLASSHFDFESAKQGNAKTEAQPAYPIEIKGTAMMPSRPLPSSAPLTPAPGTPPPRTPTSQPPSPLVGRESSVPPRPISGAPRPLSAPPAPFEVHAPIPPQRAPFGSDPSQQTPAFHPGSRVLVLWANGQRYLGAVVAVAPGRYCVAFGNGQQVWAESQYVFPAPPS